MRKTDKKIDNQIREHLTEVCEDALKEIEGFEWLTHLVNYDNFPKSLKVVCVFDTADSLACFTETNGRNKLNTIIERKLLAMKIKLNRQHILYDTEQACSIKHNGNWSLRLS